MCKLGLHVYAAYIQFTKSDIITQHPDFIYEGSIGFPHDVAVMKFTTEATLSQYVQVATLSPPGVSHVGEDCYISGWGRLGGEWHASLL